MKRRAKPIELKACDNILVNHTGTKDKLSSYWANDLFIVVKVNRFAIIAKSDVDSSRSAEMKTKIRIQTIKEVMRTMLRR